MEFYIIRLIKKDSKPLNVDNKDELKGDWKDKYYPLFNESYSEENIELFVFDSNKKIILGTIDNPNYTPICYDDVKKLVDNFDLDEIIIDNSEMSVLLNIQRFQSGLFDSNLLWNICFPLDEENTTII
tara:strand:- start:16 stop:399 length:384 start_codon:yes stop_codon:yes gene_type:complete